MKHLIVACAAAGLVVAAAPAFAVEAAVAAAPAAKFTTASSTIGALLDNAATKAVLEKHLPAIVSNPQIEMAREATLKQLQGMAGDMLSDEILAKVDADLAAIK